MSYPTAVSNIFTPATTAQSSQVNANFEEIRSLLNGNLTNSHVSASAAIAYTKLALTTLGDVFYGGASGVGSRLAGNTTTTNKFLRSVGNGSVSAAPSWEVLVAGDLPATAAKTDNANNWSTAQLPNAMGTIDLGSTSYAFRDLFFGGNSTNYHKLTGTTPTGARVHTVPDANSTTVIGTTATSNQFLTHITTGGVQTKAQPAFSDLSGSATTGQLPATVALTDNGNSWSTAQLPNAANSIDIGSSSLPFRNLFIGAANAATKFASNASGSEKTVTFPNANSNTVVPDTGAASNFLTAISSAGVISKAQPAFSDISGSPTLAQLLGSAARSLPTSGTITSGTYYHIGNWASSATGGTFESGVKVIVIGTFTLSHTGWTVGVGMKGGRAPTPAAAACVGGLGQGLGLGVSVLGQTSFGGSGGAYGGNSGGGSAAAGVGGVAGASPYSMNEYLGGSGGGAASSSSTAGPAGGDGGGGLYIYATGAVTFNESLSANGTAGSAGTGTTCGGAGGGSGGGIDVASLTSITVASTKSLTCSGGNGGADAGTSAGGGGGSGGRIRLTSPSNTVSGSLTVAGGTGGVGNTNGANGSTGTTETITATPFPRF